MRSRKGSGIVVAVTLVLLVTGSCFAEAVMSKKEKVPAASQPEDTQASGSGAITSASEAENAIRYMTQRERKLTLDLSGKKYHLEDVRLNGDQLDFVYRDGKDVKIHSCALNSIQAQAVESRWTAGPWKADLGPSCGAQLYPLDALYFVNAIASLQAFLQDEAAFQKAIADYQSQQVKPEIPEETRRYSVQAESAMDQKQYDHASDLYEKGLKISPWWAQGHFNRALMLAQTKQYGPAITEMKRYLALVPEAPDARAAQDKIYQWEDQARSPSQAEQGNADRSESDTVMMKKKMTMQRMMK